MAKEETHTRLVEVENQMTQMVAMMAEMKTFIVASRGSYPTIPNTGTSNATNTSIEEIVRIKEPIQENPPKATRELVNLEENDLAKKSSKSEG